MSVLIIGGDFIPLSFMRLDYFCVKGLLLREMAWGRELRLKLIDWFTIRWPFFSTILFWSSFNRSRWFWDMREVMFPFFCLSLRPESIDDFDKTCLVLVSFGLFLLLCASMSFTLTGDELSFISNSFGYFNGEAFVVCLSLLFGIGGSATLDLRGGNDIFLNDLSLIKLIEPLEIILSTCCRS